MNKTASEKYEKIWATVACIPYGNVATYGQIARVAGLGRQPRMVGYALHALPPGFDIPWHRVINAGGRISLPVEDGRYDLQKTLLENEGVVFKNGKVDLKRFRWNDLLDETQFP